MAASTFWPSASRMSPKTTLAPSRAKVSASAAPCPRAPPLISATFPSSFPMVFAMIIQETSPMLEEPTSLRIEDPGVRALFTEAARFQSWLDVEAALAQAQAELGIIPEAAAREIVGKAHLSFLDLAAVREGLARTGHPLVPLVWALDRACEGDAGGYVHWGATTQNVTQTGQLLQVRRAHDIFLRQLAAILTTLADLAERTKDVLLPGRTHGQHAVPATFGFKVAVWIDELGRHVERLQGCEGRVFVAMLGGGAGTLASLGERRPRHAGEDGGPPGHGARCRCPRAPSAIIRPSTSCSSACSRRRAARSGARSTP